MAERGNETCTQKCKLNSIKAIFVDNMPKLKKTKITNQQINTIMAHFWLEILFVRMSNK